MRRLTVPLLLLALAAACSHRGLPTRPPEAALDTALQRTVDSMRVHADSLYGCASRADTLWAADARQPIPTVWLAASLRIGCRIVGLPPAIRWRLRVDPAALRYDEAVVTGAIPADVDERATAVSFLGWSHRARYLPLLLRVAREPIEIPNARDYSPAYVAVGALAQWLSTSRAARAEIERSALDSTSRVRRQAAIMALAESNAPWSRALLGRVRLDDQDGYTQETVERALKARACERGQVFNVHFGIEGQDYSACGPPPDWR